MKKILFLHGFYASGQCVPAMALREAFAERAEVITPDLPMHPKEAVRFIRELIDREQPDLLIGNSCGAFYAQMVAPVAGIPALLGNPHFRMTEFLKQRIGEHQYKSPRKDGNQPKWRVFSSWTSQAAKPSVTIAILITKTVYGACSANRTRWLTLSRSSCSTTTDRFTSPAAIPPQQMKSVTGMCRWPKRC